MEWDKTNSLLGHSDNNAQPIFDADVDNNAQPIFDADVECVEWLLTLTEGDETQLFKSMIAIA